MATSLSNGIYFIESDAANQDWVGGGGDPETIDLDSFTLGTEYCYLNDSTRFSEKHKNKWNKILFPSASSFTSPMEEREAKFDFEADIPNSERQTTLKKFKEFWIKHTNISDNGYYVIIKHATNDYEVFWDDSRVEREYCKGKFDFDSEWDGDEQLYFIKGKFFDVWDD